MYNTKLIDSRKMSDRIDEICHMFGNVKVADMNITNDLRRRYALVRNKLWSLNGSTLINFSTYSKSLVKHADKRVYRNELTAILTSVNTALNNMKKDADYHALKLLYESNKGKKNSPFSLLESELKRIKHAYEKYEKAFKNVNTKIDILRFETADRLYAREANLTVDKSVIKGYHDMSLEQLKINFEGKSLSDYKAALRSVESSYNNSVQFGKFMDGLSYALYAMDDANVMSTDYSKLKKELEFAVKAGREYIAHCDRRPVKRGNIETRNKKLFLVKAAMEHANTLLDNIKSLEAGDYSFMDKPVKNNVLEQAMQEKKPFDERKSSNLINGVDEVINPYPENIINTNTNDDIINTNDDIINTNVIHNIINTNSNNDEEGYIDLKSVNNGYNRKEREAVQDKSANGKVLFREKFQQDKPEVKPVNVPSEVKTEVTAELKSVVKPVVRKTTATAVKSETVLSAKPVKKPAKKPVKPVAESVVKTVKSEVKPDVKPNVKPDVKPVVKNDLEDFLMMYQHGDFTAKVNVDSKKILSRLNNNANINMEYSKKEFFGRTMQTVNDLMKNRSSKWNSNIEGIIENEAIIARKKLGVMVCELLENGIINVDEAAKNYRKVMLHKMLGFCGKDEPAFARLYADKTKAAENFDHLANNEILFPTNGVFELKQAKNGLYDMEKMEKAVTMMAEAALGCDLSLKYKETETPSGDTMETPAGTPNPDDDSFTLIA